MLRWLCITALAVFAVASLGALFIPQDDAAPAPLRAAGDWNDSAVAGFTIKLYHTKQPALYLDAIDELAAHGFDAVQIVVPMFQRDVTATELSVTASPGRCPAPADVVALLQRANSRGLRTAVMPFVQIDQRRGDDWRGTLRPLRWDAWWASYRAALTHWLDVAREGGADAFCVGSELTSTQGQTAQWVALIDHCRRRPFDGRLYYSANFTNFGHEAVKYWPHLDMIGVNGYFDLTEGAANDPPSATDLADAWRRNRDRLLNFARAQRLPLLLTEVGYSSQSQTLRKPWDYVTGLRKPADHSAQERGYRAFIDTWGRVPSRSGYAGVFFYEWDPVARGGASDVTYGVRGKPALDVLRGWLSGRER